MPSVLESLPERRPSVPEVTVQLARDAEPVEPTPQAHAWRPAEESTLHDPPEPADAAEDGEDSSKPSLPTRSLLQVLPDQSRNGLESLGPRVGP